MGALLRLDDVIGGLRRPRLEDGPTLETESLDEMFRVGERRLEDCRHRSAAAMVSRQWSLRAALASVLALLGGLAVGGIAPSLEYLLLAVGVLGLVSALAVLRTSSRLLCECARESLPLAVELEELDLARRVKR